MPTPEDIAQQLDITPDVVRDRLLAIGLDHGARDRLRAVAGPADARHPAFTEDLYARFAANPETAAFLANEAQVAHLKRQQQRYLHDLVTADLDWAYALRRLAIGMTHHRVGLAPQWYLTTYALVLVDYVDLFFHHAPSPAIALEWTCTLARTIFFDATLVLDAYGRSRDIALWQEATARDPEDNQPVSLPRPSAAADSPLRAHAARIDLSLEDTGQRREFIGLSEDDIQHLRSLRPHVETQSAAILADFYTFIETMPALAPLVPGEVATRLQQQVARYWVELTAATFDRPYAASRMRIGVMHEQVGLTLPWYLAGLARQFAGFLAGLDPQRPDTPARICAFTRAVFFDLSCVVDAYMQARADTLLRIEGYASQLIAGLSAAVAVVDASDRLISANRTLINLVGGEASVLYLMPLDHALPMREAGDMVRAVRQRSDRERGRQLARIARHGGRTLRISAMPLAGSADSLSGAIALVIDDVTDLFRVGDALEQRDATLERLSDAVGFVHWELDLLSWTITSIGGAVEELTGYRDVFYLGRPSAWIDRIVEADRARFVASASALKRGQRGEIEYRVRRTDGNELWVRSRLCAVARNGSVALAAATVDVTARKRSEALRLEAIATIAGGIAHVINNALTGVIGGIEMHARERGGLDEAPLLKLALDSARVAGTTTTQLLAFAGQQALDPVTLSLSEVTQAAQPMLRALLGSAVNVVLDLDANLWPCRADQRMLVRTLECLADNSRQAMGSAGTFRVTTRNRRGRDLTTAGLDAAHDWVEWRISDTGQGMSEAVRRQAFHPFFTTRSLAEATGLGLSMVYGFITQCGGHLAIESQPGQGTTVIIRLPRSAVADAVAPEPQPPLVLLVEDQEEVRRVTAVMLKALGYRVIDTGDVTEARRLADILHPQVLVTDVILGQGVDGMALSAQLVTSHPALSIVLMSGYSRVNLDASRLPVPFQFLPKPFTLDELELRLRQTPFPPPLA